MAKLFARAILAAQNQMYSTKKASITASSLRDWESNGLGRVGTVAGKKFDIQLAKRIKGTYQSAVINSGDRLVDRINKAKHLDWETVTSVTITRQDFLINISPDDDIDFTNNPSDLTQKINAQMGITIEREEETAIANIVAAGQITQGAIAAGKIKVVSLGAVDSDPSEGLAELGNKLFGYLSIATTDAKQFIDDYQSGGTPETHISTVGIKALIAYMGNTFTSGINPESQSIAPSIMLSPEEPAFENGYFDRFTIDTSAIGGTTTDRLVAIIKVPFSYYYSGINKGIKKINQTILDENFVGYSYNSGNAIAMPNRMLIITAGNVGTKPVKKVDE